MLIELVVAFLTFFITLYLYVQWKFTYWKRRGLPYHKPNFPLGLYQLRNAKYMHFKDIIKEQWDYFKSQGNKHFGIYLGTRAVYIPIHPELIRNIMVKDFNYFNDRGFYYNEKDDPLNVHLLTLQGQKWKDMREKLSPIFTSSKVKMLVEYVLNSSNGMVSMIETLSKTEGEIDMKEITNCYTTDVVTSCIFGIDCNSFQDNQNEFRKHTRAFFSPLTTFGKIKWLIMACSTKLGRLLRLSVTPEETAKFFLRVIKENVEFRERTNFYRPDLMQLFIELKNNRLGETCTPNKVGIKQNLTMMELTAHCFLFFNAAVQSTASTITFCLYELTRNLNVQEKLRNEINKVVGKSDGQFTYDNIMEMKYLHQVVEETLRMYPSLYLLTRQCIEDYKIPKTNITIEKGTIVFLPISALHRDAEFFSEPNKFDPERFNKTNKPNIRPFTYLPFGEGPKFCIASRLGEIQVKIGLAVLLKNFRFTLNRKSSSIKCDAYMPMLAFDGPAWFDIEKI